MNQVRVDSITPCAASGDLEANHGAHGVTRPTLIFIERPEVRADVTTNLRSGIRSSRRREEVLTFAGSGAHKPGDLSLLTSAATIGVGVFKSARSFALVLLLISALPLRAENPSAEFDAANRLYAQNKFPEAAASYERLIATGSVSPALYFNLGNANFKSGQIGRAIAAYRQAETLAPRDPDVRANLQFARAQVQGATLRATLLQRALGTLSLNEWTGLGAGALWITFFLLAWRQIRPSLATALRNWTWLAGVVALGLCVAVALAYLQNPARDSVIVSAHETTVRNGPFDESPGTFTANDGAELRLLDRKNDWLQVTDGTRRIGWLKREAVLYATQP
jgi:tetratricopeptide (TPR) repeat protein